MEKDPEWQGVTNLREQQRRIAEQQFFGIDKETDLVRIAKAHMAIAGDGRSNLAHENTLHDPEDYEGRAKSIFVKNGQLRQFDLILTNPPYGTKTKVLEEDAGSFVLGHARPTWDGREWNGHGKPEKRDPYILFVERSLQMLKNGGTLAIVLPETVFHAPRKKVLREYILRGNNLRAIVSIPHNAFRPYCNAKTCLIVFTKGETQDDTIIMANPEEMGHDHTGRTIYRIGTDEVWDDLAVVLEELEDPTSPNNKHTFTVSWSDVTENVLVPSYYQRLLIPPRIPSGHWDIRLQDMIDEEMIEHWDGHGSPASEDKGRGNIPYIRVKDIVNWELYRNPLDGVTEDVYESLTRNKRTLDEGDIVFVRRGSYRIGTVAMASKRDRKLLLTRELLTIRLVKNTGEWSPFYLLYLLSTSFVQKQMKQLTFMDTTLPNIGGRWRELILAPHKDQSEVQRIESIVKKSIQDKWRAQERIESLRDDVGGLTT